MHDVVGFIAAVSTFWSQMITGLFGTRQLSAAVEAPKDTGPIHTYLRTAPVKLVQC